VIRRRRRRNEKDISTEQVKTEKNARLSGPVQDEERQGGTAPSQGERPQETGRLSFFRELRITNRPRYKRCYARGRRFLTRSFILFVLPVPDRGQWCLGIAASRKVGNAVRRNRIKRLIREVFRVNQHEIKLKADIVVVVKRSASIAELNYHRVEKELLPCLKKIQAQMPAADHSG
jgi:ribonuclease P protein component